MIKKWLRQKPVSNFFKKSFVLFSGMPRVLRLSHCLSYIVIYYDQVAPMNELRTDNFLAHFLE